MTNLDVPGHLWRGLEDRARVEECTPSRVAEIAIGEYLARRNPPKRVYGTNALTEWERRLRAGKGKALKDLRDAAHRPGTLPPDRMQVDTYAQLADVATFLSVMNKTLVLLFRGQTEDWPLAATLHRATTWKLPFGGGTISPHQHADHYFSHLETVSGVVREVLRRRGLPRWRHMEMSPPAAWAVVQHYELWPTPLLDFSSSLRIAASFAFGFDDECPEGFLDVVGVGSVSSDLMTFTGPELAIRLNSVCPPGAVRPHLQEGVLLGWYRPGHPQPVGPPPGMGATGISTPYLPIARIHLRNRGGAFWANPDYPINREDFLLPTSEHDRLLQEFGAELRYGMDSRGRGIVNKA